MEWVEVILEWVNCLGLTENPVNYITELGDGQFFCKIVMILFRQPYKIKNKVKVFDVLRQSLQGHYTPSNWINVEHALQGNTDELIKIVSVLIGISGLQSEQKLFWEKPMKSLSVRSQARLMKFLKYVLQNWKIVDAAFIQSMDNKENNAKGLGKKGLSSVAQAERFLLDEIAEKDNKISKLKDRLKGLSAYQQDLTDDNNSYKNKTSELTKRCDDLEKENQSLKQIANSYDVPPDIKSIVNDLRIKLKMAQDYRDIIDGQLRDEKYKASKLERQLVSSKKQLEKASNDIISKDEIIQSLKREIENYRTGGEKKGVKRKPETENPKPCVSSTASISHKPREFNVYRGEVIGLKNQEPPPQAKVSWTGRGESKRLKWSDTIAIKSAVVPVGDKAPPQLTSPVSVTASASSIKTSTVQPKVLPQLDTPISVTAPASSTKSSNVQPTLSITRTPRSFVTAKSRKRVACKICCKSFKRNADVERHMEVHSNERPYLCVWQGCGKAYKRESVLLDHVKEKHELIEKPRATCQVCSKSFRDAGGLKKHMDVHSSERPYLCDWQGCGLDYKRKQDLLQHVKENHQLIKQPRRATCQVCPATFIDACALRRHMAVHSDEKLYPCEWPGCEKAYKDRIGLERHVEERHIRQDGFLCDWPDCNFSCKTENGLRRHTDVIHRHKKQYRRKTVKICDAIQLGTKIFDVGEDEESMQLRPVTEQDKIDGKLFIAYVTPLVRDDGTIVGKTVNISENVDPSRSACCIRSTIRRGKHSKKVNLKRACVVRHAITDKTEWEVSRSMPMSAVYKGQMVAKKARGWFRHRLRAVGCIGMLEPIEWWFKPFEDFMESQARECLAVYDHKTAEMVRKGILPEVFVNPSVIQTITTTTIEKYNELDC